MKSNDEYLTKTKSEFKEIKILNNLLTDINHTNFEKNNILSRLDDIIYSNSEFQLKQDDFKSINLKSDGTFSKYNSRKNTFNSNNTVNKSETPIN